MGLPSNVGERCTDGKQVLLRHCLEQGPKKTELAEKLGMSRRTVYQWIETQQLDRELDDEAVHYTSQPLVTKWIDPYRGIIQAQLEQFPRLSGKRLKLREWECRAAAAQA